MRFIGLISLFGIILGAFGCGSHIPTGVVEGFYGDPWSHSARLDVIEFLGDHDQDLFIYAPKDDPLHRADWRTPYTEEEMALFRELVQACLANDVNFCFAVSPGRDMTYSDPEEQRLLLEKMMSLHPEGVTHFALFLDDINVDRMGEADRARFATAVEAQMFLANALNQQILAREPDAWFLICPTAYAGTTPRPYWDTLREQLDPGIEVVWTGPQVVSSTISEDDLDAITAQFGRPPFIWDNYPVNDFWRGGMRLGPIDGRAPDMMDRISGYAANPMNEAHASLISLATIADFLDEGPRYDPEASWEKAIQEIGGDNAEDLRRFAENCRVSDVNDTESRVLIPLIEQFRINPDEATTAALVSKIEEIIAATQRLRVNLDPPLVADLARHLDAMEARMGAMRGAVRLITESLPQEEAEALVAAIDAVRDIDVKVAGEAGEMLFTTALGRSQAWLALHSSTRAIDNLDAPEGSPFSGRGRDQLAVYTPARGTATTGTNTSGVEATVVNGVVVSVGGNDSPIPPNGFIVSGHGASRRWIQVNLAPDVPVTHTETEVRVGDVPAEQLTPEQRLNAMRERLLRLIRPLVETGSRPETLRQVREAMQRVDGFLLEPVDAETMGNLEDVIESLERRL